MMKSIPYHGNILKEHYGVQLFPVGGSYENLFYSLFIFIDVVFFRFSLEFRFRDYLHIFIFLVSFED